MGRSFEKLYSCKGGEQSGFLVFTNSEWIQIISVFIAMIATDFLFNNRNYASKAVQDIQSSSRKHDIVLDGCGGSGTTLIAEEQAERICSMSELDPKYCDVIRKRYEKLTGNKAKLP